MQALHATIHFIVYHLPIVKVTSCLSLVISLSLQVKNMAYWLWRARWWGEYL